MALEVGNVLTRLGYKVDDHGAQQYKRQVAELRSETRRDITQHAGLDVDHRGIDGYKREIRSVDDEHGKLLRGSGRLKSGLGALWVGGAGVAAGALAFGGLAKGAMSAYGAFEESNKIAKETDAVLKSTGGAANVTAKQVSDLATSISKKTGIDDEQIQSSENLLLTFTNVRNEVGKGNDIFSQATSIVTDMSAALGQDTKSSAIQLGKALNDPIKGITALSRVGVSFTAGQKDQIKTLVAHGKTVQAQKLILGELTKEFGGSAAAQATWMDRLKVTFGNLMETIGGKIAPVIEDGAKWLDKFVNGMQDGTGTGGKFVTMLKDAGGVLRSVVSTVAGFVSSVRSSGRSTSDAAKGIRSGVDSIKRTLAAMWVTAKGIVRDVTHAFSGMGSDIRIIGTRLAQVWGAAWGLLSSIVRRALPGLRAVIGGLATVVRGVVDVIAGLLTLDFARVWTGVKRIVTGAVRAVGGAIRELTAPFREVMSRIGGILGDGLGKVTTWAGNLATSATRAGRNFVSRMIGGAKALPGDLWNAIKGAPGKVVAMGNDAETAARNAGGKIVSGVVNRVKSLPGELFHIGKNAVAAIGRGLKGIGAGVAGLAGDVGRAIANWVNANTLFGDKIHINLPGPKDIDFRLPALARGGKVGPTAGGARAFIAGEGNADEWVISQEGDRHQNVRWAVDALQALTGRSVELHAKGKGRKHKKKKHHGYTAPTAGSVERRSISRGERGMANFERDIQRLNRQYGQLDRRYDQSEEEYLIEHDDGSVTVDQAAIAKRVKEIDALVSFIRDQIEKKIKDYRASIASAIRAYNSAISRLGRAIKRKGKHKLSRSERDQYQKQIDTYTGRIGELNDVHTDLGLDLEDSELDVGDLEGEKTEIKGSTGTAAPAAAPEDVSTDAGGADLATPDATVPEPEQVPPSASEIAAAALAQLSAFQSARSDLFSSFGGNTVAASRMGAYFPGDATAQAAGTRDFGAVDGGTGGGTTVNQTFNFAGGPADEHTFSQRVASEMRAAI